MAWNIEPKEYMSNLFESNNFYESRFLNIYGAIYPGVPHLLNKSSF